MRDGEVSDPQALGQHLKSFAAAAGLPRNVRIGVANQQIVVRVVELPRIEDEKQRDAAVRFQASEAIAMPLDEAVLDHQVAGYTTAADGTARMQVVLVAARRKMIETLLEAVKAAGLKADGVDLDAFALVRALAVESDEPEQTARVFCHLGGVTNLAVAVGSNCFFTRPLSAVWDEDDAGSRLADEIRLSIDYYMTQPQAKPVGEVVLSGPGSVDGQLVEGLETHLGIPVTVPAPLGTLDGSALGRERGSRTATPWRPASRWEQRHEARKPASRRTSAGASPARATARALRSCSACSARCSRWSSSTC